MVNAAERWFYHRLDKKIQLLYLRIAKEIEDHKKGYAFRSTLLKFPERKIYLFYKEYMQELVRNYLLPPSLYNNFLPCSESWLNQV